MTTQSQTFQSGLSIALAANETANFCGYVAGDANNNDNCEIMFDGPAGASVEISVAGQGAVRTQAYRMTDLGPASGEDTKGVVIFKIYAGNDGFYFINGTVINGSTSGNLELKYRSTDGETAGILSKSFLAKL